MTFQVSPKSWDGSTALDVGPAVEVPAVHPCTPSLGEVHAPPGSAKTEAILATFSGFEIDVVSANSLFTLFRATRR